MKYREFIPGEALRPYIQCYYIFESAAGFTLDDVVFPAGNMEVIFNLGDAVWQSAPAGSFSNTPQIELWGQITQPLAVRTMGRNCMLGIKFYPHTAACFFNENVGELNDQIYDTGDVLGKEFRELHARLQEETALGKRITLLEHFFMRKLLTVKRKDDKIALVGSIVHDLKTHGAEGRITELAGKYRFTTRYIHKLFLQYTGVAPKHYAKLGRFQRSLALVQQGELSLTSIAYECGYFDQSHFIREFKAFTGIAPASYAANTYPFNDVLVKPD